MKKETAFFGAGCFWHVELAFSKIPGVLKTEAGYMGGDESEESVRYEEVCTDTTGHAEVVKVEFDAGKVNYEKILDVFWEIHDPTQLNRQGVDVGTQYRSAIFFTNKKQKKIAEQSLAREQKRLGKKKIVTKIVSAGKFYKAEEYHQKYLEKRGRNTCRI